MLDRFTVRDPDFAGEPPPDRLGDIADGRFAGRSRRRRRRRSGGSGTRSPRSCRRPPAGRCGCGFDNESSRQATIIEVFAHDSPGLLFQVARALHDAGLSVRAARIGTYLDQVVDAFHVTDSAGRKLSDPGRLRALRENIARAVAPIIGPR